MVSKIIAFACTFLVNLVSGVAILFFMLIAMNGYSESDATWGLGVYAVAALTAAIATGFGAVYFAKYLFKKNKSPLTALLISIALFSLIGSVLQVICSLIGVGVAEFVRVRF